jgi:hypothetical protein
MRGQASASTVPRDLTPYFNYVKMDTSSFIDAMPGYTSFQCGPTEPCVQLHNGGMIFFRHASFNGTATTNAISFIVDPDGRFSDSTTNGPGKSILFYIYYNGRLTSLANILPGTCDSQECPSSFSADPTHDPTWFRW